MPKKETRKELRSRIMRAVRGKNTVPEISIRSILHALGLRFRLHDVNLPGTPDIVLKKYKTAIFVHGCFWHGHNCSKGRLPKTNPDFWFNKIEKNKKRDRRVSQALRRLGWRTLTIWQCRLKDPDKIKSRMLSFFDKNQTLR